MCPQYLQREREECAALPRSGPAERTPLAVQFSQAHRGHLPAGQGHGSQGRPMQEAEVQQAGAGMSQARLPRQEEPSDQS